MLRLLMALLVVLLGCAAPRASTTPTPPPGAGTLPANTQSAQAMPAAFRQRMALTAQLLLQ
jgi:hypothetical protein